MNLALIQWPSIPICHCVFFTNLFTQNFLADCFESILLIWVFKILEFISNVKNFAHRSRKSKEASHSIDIIMNRMAHDQLTLITEKGLENCLDLRMLCIVRIKQVNLFFSWNLYQRQDIKVHINWRFDKCWFCIDGNSFLFQEIFIDWFEFLAIELVINPNDMIFSEIEFFKTEEILWWRLECLNSQGVQWECFSFFYHFVNF